MEAMLLPSETHSLMYQDFSARRPLEIETFLGSPIKLAKEVGLQVPRIETLYALLHNINIANQKRPVQQATSSPNPANGPPVRMSSFAGSPGMNGPMNGNMNGPMSGPMNGNMNGHMNGPMNGPRGGMRPGSRAPSMSGGAPPPMRRGPSQNGYPPRMMNGHGPMSPRGPPMQRRPSMEGNDLEEFSHLMLYDGMADGHGQEYGGPYPDGPAPTGDIALRERELMLRQRELALREQEIHMRRGPPPPPGMRRGPPPPPSRGGGGFDDEDDDDDGDYFDPMKAGPGPQIDPDNFDMMSVTSRRTRKAPSSQQLRQNMEMGGSMDQRRSRNPFNRPKPVNRTSARLMADVPGLHDSIMSNPMMGYSSDRYGGVDRHQLGMESRSNSLTAERLNELQAPGHGPYGAPTGPGAPPFPPSRRASQSPGNPLSPRPMQRRSPPSGYEGPMPIRNGRTPPGMSEPVPRHAPGHGNAVAPQQVEEQVVVSNLYPPKRLGERSLTGSASASAGSGESAHSARIDSEPSAHSSSSSLGPRPRIGVR